MSDTFVFLQKLIAQIINFFKSILTWAEDASKTADKFTEAAAEEDTDA